MRVGLIAHPGGHSAAISPHQPERNISPVTDDAKNHPIRPRESREQATDYLGFMASVVYDLGESRTWELPNPSFMDPEMKARYLEHLRFMAEDLDTVERTDPVTKDTTHVQRYPLRYNGKLINDEELLCVALMGGDDDYEKYIETGSQSKGKWLRGALPDTYERFLAAGGVPGQVNTAWQVMQRQLQERLQRDSKSR